MAHLVASTPDLGGFRQWPSMAMSLECDPKSMLTSSHNSTIVLPKSVSPSRIAANSKVKELSMEQLHALNAAEENKRFNNPQRWDTDIRGALKRSKELD